MKKLKRNFEKFDSFDLFAEVILDKGHDFNDPIALERFIETVGQSIAESKENKNIVFGKRTEFLFAYVAGALGEVALLKQEDAGDIYFYGDDKLAPDYRVTFHDHKQILIEVKNCHSKNQFCIKKNYYLKLKRYADLNKLDLKFAVYFSSPRLWVLLSIDNFDEYEDVYKIHFAKALACSEMSILGDCMIGTAPDLELHFLSNTGEEINISDLEQQPLNTLEIKIYCAGNEITDPLEKKIAFHFIQFGNWLEKDVVQIIEKSKTVGVKFLYSPEYQEEPNFAMIGTLSTMITKGFFDHTTKNGEIVALKPKDDPRIFQVFIPMDYKSQNLPLWRFFIQPNPKFKLPNTK